jgi:hypothetical protein
MQPSQPVKPHAAPTHHDHGGAFEDAQPHPMHAAEPASQASCRTHPSTHPSIHPSSRAQVERAGIDGSLVDDVIVGCVSQTGAQAGNIGRNMVLASVKAKPRSITHPSPLPSPLLHLTVTRCAQLVTRNAAKVQWHMLHWCGSVFARQPPFAKKHHPGLTIHVGAITNVPALVASCFLLREHTHARATHNRARSQSPSPGRRLTDSADRLSRRSTSQHRRS